MMQKKVLLLPNLTKHNTAELVPKIIRQLILCGCQPLALTEYEGRFGGLQTGGLESLLAECDLVLTVGGDGTILSSSSFICFSLLSTVLPPFFGFILLSALLRFSLTL